MFLCDKCAEKYRVGDFEKTFGLRSHGKCEGCGEIGSCIDAHYYRCRVIKETPGCKYCGGKITIKSRITDTERSKQKSYFASCEHKNCNAQHGIHYLPSEDSVIEWLNK